jgi:hypothetical protein
MFRLLDVTTTTVLPQERRTGDSLLQVDHFEPKGDRMRHVFRVRRTGRERFRCGSPSDRGTPVAQYGGSD